MKKTAKLLILLAFLVACAKNDAVEENGIRATAESIASTATKPSEAVIEEVAQNSESVTIRFASYDWAESNYTQLMQAFTAVNPDITIEYVPFSEVLEIALDGSGTWPEDSGLRLASAADVIDIVFQPEEIAQGVALDLMPLLVADGLGATDFYPGILQGAQQTGSLYYLPAEARPSLFYYNKAVFDATNIAYPQPDWTWDDFLQTAKLLTLSDGEEVTQWGFVDPYFNPLYLIESQTGLIYNPRTEPPLLRFDDLAVANGVRWYTDLSQEHEISPYFPPEDNESGIALVRNGRIAIWVDMLDNWQQYGEQMNIGIAPYPIKTPGGNSTPIISTGLSISAGTNKTDAAWRWLRFLSENVPDNGFYGASTVLPTRPALAGAAGFWNRFDEETAAAFRYALNHSFRPSRDAYRPMRDAVQAVFAGQSIEAALAQAQNEAIVENDEVGGETAVTPITVTEPEPINEDATIVRFIVGGSFSGLSPYRHLAESFQETRPDIIIDILPPPAGRGSIPRLAATSDCFQWFNDDLSNLANQAAILNLDPFFAADSVIGADDFFDVALDGYRNEGQLWGLPRAMTLSGIAYNKSLFTAAAQPFPTTDWTTDQFLRLAIALTERQGDATTQYGYLPSAPEGGDLFLFLDQLGAQIVDKDSDPPIARFDHPSTIEAMRWYTNLALEYGVRPMYLDDFEALEQRKLLIEGGRVAMWIVDGFNGGSREDTSAFELGFVPLPLGENGRSHGGIRFTDGYFISAGTDLRQACWDWITFLTEQPTLGASDYSLPARRSTAESEAYRQAVGAERAAVNLASVLNATVPPLSNRFTPKNGWLPGTSWWLADSYQQIMAEGVSVEDALADSQQKLTLYAACLIERDGFTNDTERANCLREVDDSLPSFLYEVEEE